jgi:hypothetical protein
LTVDSHPNNDNSYEHVLNHICTKKQYMDSYRTHEKSNGALKFSQFHQIWHPQHHSDSNMPQPAVSVVAC